MNVYSLLVVAPAAAIPLLAFWHVHIVKLRAVLILCPVRKESTCIQDSHRQCMYTQTACPMCPHQDARHCRPWDGKLGGGGGGCTSVKYVEIVALARNM